MNKDNKEEKCNHCGRGICVGCPFSSPTESEGWEKEFEELYNYSETAEWLVRKEYEYDKNKLKNFIIKLLQDQRNKLIERAEKEFEEMIKDSKGREIKTLIYIKEKIKSELLKEPLQD